MAIKLCIIGDSNVDRHFAKVKSARNDPCFQNVTVVRATNLAQVKEAVCPPELAEARSHVLLACVTNPIADYQFTDVPALLKHCEAIFTQLKSFIAEGRANVPGDLEQVIFSSFIAVIIHFLHFDFYLRKHKIFVCLRSTWCHPCTESVPSGIKEIFRKFLLPSLLPFVSLSATHLRLPAIPTQLSSEMEFT
jgi:hypothetical protein